MSLRASKASRSEPGLDALRGLVVLMMVVVHARRVQVSRGPGLLDTSLQLFMWLEPYIAASFLFIAGYSLVLSRAKAKDGWLPKLLRRAAMLYALAIVLFVPQYGLELPDLLLSPGILSAIALAIALTGAALSLRVADAALALVAVGVLAVTFALERLGESIPMLNAGPGGAFPLIAFTAAGALVARARQRSGERALVVATVAAVPALGLVSILGARWVTDHVSYYSAHAGELALTELASALPKRPVRFWNHSTAGALGLMLPLLLSLWAALRSGEVLGRLALARPLLVLGRHALGAYVVHLGLLGVVDLAGAGPKTAAGTWALVVGLWLSLFALAYALDARAELLTARARAERRAG